MISNFILEELRLGQQPKTLPPPMQLENFEKIWDPLTSSDLIRQFLESMVKLISVIW